MNVGLELDRFKRSSVSGNGWRFEVGVRMSNSLGTELYRHRAKEEWPRTADGSLAMDTRPLDLDALLRELK
jgi:catechol 2,3-dioxygenase